MKDSKRYHLRQGEEGLTSNILREIWRHPGKFPGIYPVQTRANYERVTGSDWEWWFGNDRDGWMGYAVQAKKLYTQKSKKKNANWENGGYSELNHKVAGKYQYKILNDYARRRGMIPLYAFYNHIVKTSYGCYWQCCDHPQQPDERKLGITVTPLATVRRALSPKHKMPRTFDAIHKCRRTLPARCLVCPKGWGIYPANAEQGNVPAHPGWKIYHSKAELYDKKRLDDHLESIQQERRGKSWNDDVVEFSATGVLKFHTDHKAPDETPSG
ncbi:MAG: hypothetical protein MPK31_09215 [Gammaproteobacteria bacterium]|nr:hypothetical protein [Gammaproteobacteria bacterium]